MVKLLSEVNVLGAQPYLKAMDFVFSSKWKLTVRGWMLCGSNLNLRKTSELAAFEGIFLTSKLHLKICFEPGGYERGVQLLLAGQVGV